MCGRYTSQSPPDVIADYFHVDEVVAPELGVRFNVAPSQDVYAVAQRHGVRRLGSLRWGLVPFWADDPKIGNRMINARAETLATSSAFKRSFARRRCLVPADGFYEWQAVPGAKRKQPYYIRRRDGQPLAFAGLWEVWRPKDAPEGDEESRLSSCTIVTTDANELLAPIHDRMPVILPPGVWDEWLDPDNEDVDRLSRLLVPAPEDLLELIPVGPDVSKVDNEGPHLIERVDPVEAAPPDVQQGLFPDPA